MGPVTYFSLSLLVCLIFNPSLEASPRLGPGTRVMPCPSGWLHYSEHCYRFFPEKMTWSAAEMKCQYHHNGAHLASILTEAERDVVASYLAKSGFKDPVWIGLHDPDKNRPWTWTDGSPYRHNAWKAGEPQNLNNDEYCTELMDYRGFKNWNDKPCDKQNAYVCKYER